MSRPLISIVTQNLVDQHDWTSLETHEDLLPRQLLSGLPPRRVYMHPEEQIEALKIEKSEGKRPSQDPEFEWVLPVSLAETWSLRDFAAVFDSIPALPRRVDTDLTNPLTEWRGEKRGKRLLLAVVHNDSTISYYLVHDGIVKPRPN